MLNSIIAFSLKNRLPLLVAALALAGYGTFRGGGACPSTCSPT